MTGATVIVVDDLARSSVATAATATASDAVVGHVMLACDGRSGNQDRIDGVHDRGAAAHRVLGSLAEAGRSGDEIASGQRSAGIDDGRVIGQVGEVGRIENLGDDRDRILEVGAAEETVGGRAVIAGQFHEGVGGHGGLQRCQAAARCDSLGLAEGGHRVGIEIGRRQAGDAGGGKAVEDLLFAGTPGEERRQWGDDHGPAGIGADLALEDAMVVDAVMLGNR